MVNMHATYMVNMQHDTCKLHLSRGMVMCVSAFHSSTSFRFGGPGATITKCEPRCAFYPYLARFVF